MNVLLSAPDAQRIRVWREGLEGWQEAGTVPEVSRKLPPPTPSVAPRGPESGAGVAGTPDQLPDASGPIPFERAEAVARLYRRLVLLVGFQLLLSCFVQLPQSSTRGEVTAVAAIALFVVFGIAIAIIITTYQLMRQLGAGAPIGWALGMFLPCLNILVLLGVSSRAQEWCRRYGIPVGFFGPRKESIQRLRRGEAP